MDGRFQSRRRPRCSAWRGSRQIIQIPGLELNRFCIELALGLVSLHSHPVLIFLHLVCLGTGETVGYFGLDVDRRGEVWLLGSNRWRSKCDQGSDGSPERLQEWGKLALVACHIQKMRKATPVRKDTNAAGIDFLSKGGCRMYVRCPPFCFLSVTI